MVDMWLQRALEQKRRSLFLSFLYLKGVYLIKHVVGHTSCVCGVSLSTFQTKIRSNFIGTLLHALSYDMATLIHAQFLNIVHG